MYFWGHVTRNVMTLYGTTCWVEVHDDIDDVLFAIPYKVNIYFSRIMIKKSKNEKILSFYKVYYALWYSLLWFFKHKPIILEISKKAVSRCVQIPWARWHCANIIAPPFPLLPLNPDVFLGANNPRDRERERERKKHIPFEQSYHRV